MLDTAWLSYDKLSVCLSVTLRYCQHIGWNSSKFKNNSTADYLEVPAVACPTLAIWLTGTPLKIRMEQGWRPLSIKVSKKTSHCMGTVQTGEELESGIRK